MPPKAKFTKKEIIAAAFEIVRLSGFDALTARSLADKLGSSPRPIFTVFSCMEEVQEEVKTAARKLYEQYEDEEMCGEKPFRGSGIGSGEWELPIFALPWKNQSFFSFCLCVKLTLYRTWILF